ncbi:hypothetical protein C7M84_017670 [Penaeus vannamei]|uniref:Uncharacterized protein n=1 Tax=Penaeus vannamei TaxID=6689 RepID=A0A423SJL3_PENVA|nr:hypothetical protein C7M84_017670 [Penaeus vannamei]
MPGCGMTPYTTIIITAIMIFIAIITFITSIPIHIIIVTISSTISFHIYLLYPSCFIPFSSPCFIPSFFHIYSSSFLPFLFPFPILPSLHFSSMLHSSFLPHLSPPPCFIPFFTFIFPPSFLHIYRLPPAPSRFLLALLPAIRGSLPFISSIPFYYIPSLPSTFIFFLPFPSFHIYLFYPFHPAPPRPPSVSPPPRSFVASLRCIKTAFLHLSLLFPSFQNYLFYLFLPTTFPLPSFHIYLFLPSLPSRIISSISSSLHSPPFFHIYLFSASPSFHIYLFYPSTLLTPSLWLSSPVYKKTRLPSTFIPSSLFTFPFPSSHIHLFYLFLPATFPFPFFHTYLFYPFLPSLPSRYISSIPSTLHLYPFLPVTFPFSLPLPSVSLPLLLALLPAPSWPVSRV